MRSFIDIVLIVVLYPYALPICCRICCCYTLYDVYSSDNLNLCINRWAHGWRGWSWQRGRWRRRERSSPTWSMLLNAAGTWGTTMASWSSWQDSGTHRHKLNHLFCHSFFYYFVHHMKTPPFFLQIPKGAEDVAVYGPDRHWDHAEPEGCHGSAWVLRWIQEACDPSP